MCCLFVMCFSSLICHQAHICHVRGDVCFKNTFWRLCLSSRISLRKLLQWFKELTTCSPQGGFRSVHYLSFTQRLLLWSQSRSFLDQTVHTITFLQIPPGLWVRLVSVCLHVSLPAVEGSASQISSPLVGDQTSGSSTEWWMQNGEETSVCCSAETSTC